MRKRLVQRGIALVEPEMEVTAIGLVFFTEAMSDMH